MGIISPKKPVADSKISIALLAIALFPVLIIFLFLFLLWGAVLAIAIWITWKNPRVLFVYSDSPTWKDYIEREILPYLRDRAVILNWSERRNWRTSLPVLAFRYFGGDKNFNPIGMVFRPFHLVKTYRFYEAFKDFKHGRPRKVEEIKRALFETLGVKTS
jgi:hypothetical protein